MKTLVICLDDNHGMMFNNRRQSRDACVVAKIQEMASTSTLYRDNYSKTLFPDGQAIMNYNNDGFYFIENPDLLSNDAENIFDQIIIFRWNREYPADKILMLNLKCYNMETSVDFAGKSHEKITMEVYKKKGDCLC